MLHGWLIIDKPVGPGSTQVVSAVKRALRRAPATKIHYDPPHGTASVHISLPLEQLWRELDAAR